MGEKTTEELIEELAAAYARKGLMKKANAVRALNTDMKMPEVSALFKHIVEGGLSEGEEIALGLLAVISGLD